jgi:transcriptional regulator with XRE-family HTH domain
MEVDYLSLGKRIRHSREKRSMSQLDLSEKSGLSRSYISQIEMGQFNVSLDAVIAIANALGISSDELLIDSLEKSGKKGSSEADYILLDCSPSEEKILTENMKSLRETLRPFNIK